MRTLLLSPLGLLQVACQSAYCEAAEQVGNHKRDILVDRVEASRDAQQDAVERFHSTPNDNVLYLKHNLNTRAVAALQVEFRAIEDDIEALIAEMRRAIASSDAFIESMQ